MPRKPLRDWNPYFESGELFEQTLPYAAERVGGVPEADNVLNSAYQFAYRRQLEVRRRKTVIRGDGPPSTWEALIWIQFHPPPDVEGWDWAPCFQTDRSAAGTVPQMVTISRCPSCASEALGGRCPNCAGCRACGWREGAPTSEAPVSADADQIRVVTTPDGPVEVPVSIYRSVPPPPGPDRELWDRVHRYFTDDDPLRETT